MTLPVAFSGSASRKTTERGTLKPAIRVLLQASSSSAVTGVCWLAGDDPRTR